MHVEGIRHWVGENYCIQMYLLCIQHKITHDFYRFVATSSQMIGTKVDHYKVFEHDFGVKSA